MNDMEIIQPFGCSIGKYKLPDNILKGIIKVTDNITENYKADGRESYNLGSQLVGRLNEQLSFSPPMLYDEYEDYNQFLLRLMEKYVYGVWGSQVKSMKDMKMSTQVDLGMRKIVAKTHKIWINNQVENEYNPAHVHPDGVSKLTSVLFLKVPKCITIKDKPDGYLHIIGSSQEQMKSGNLEFSDYFIKPKAGYFYIFPSYLKHTAYPFRGDGIRRTLVLNSDFDFKKSRLWEMNNENKL